MAMVPWERVCIFIDGSNLYYAAKKVGIQIDFRRLLEYFTRDAILLRAFYYTALSDEPQFQWLRDLVTWLGDHGYTVVSKPMKMFTNTITDNNGNEKEVVERKGDIDIELAIDMLALAEHYDRAILFSGDGDLRRLVEEVQRKGVRVQVISTKDVVAEELRRQADEFIDLNDNQLIAALQRESSKKNL